MNTLLGEIQSLLSKSLKVQFDAELELKSNDVTLCQREDLGHYQCNSALRFAKLLKMKPRDVAEKIIEALPSKEIFSKIEIAGPGFINFTFHTNYLSSRLDMQGKDPFLGARAIGEKKRIIVEFSSPNVAKELHVGHLRSTIIGDSLARLFEFLGHDVIRLNHVGDWGTQFGMLIAYMLEEAPEVLSGKKKADLSQLMTWYREAKLRFDQDAEFKKKSQLEVVRLQSEEKEAFSSWQRICEISRRGYQEIYNLLNVKIQERGESFYNPYLKSIVEELESKKLIEISDGAKCIFFHQFKNREGNPLPLMVQKSDGGFNYDTTDLAAIRYRILVDKAERIIYVTDLGQSLHFQMVFAAAEKAGWLDPAKTQIDHVGFGLVLGSDGKKFKTRSGDTEKLIDLLTEAISKAKAGILERSPEMDPSEMDHLARVLGIGAVKYADLSSSRTKDYTFSYDRMLRFEGNTAVFLLYSYVRIQGIQRKVGKTLKGNEKIDLSHPSEVSLALHLLRFGEVLKLMSEDLYPNHLTDYLYNLAEKFNAFFRDCRVVGSEEEASRLLLSHLAGKILSKGLILLGIETVDRM